MSVHSRRSHFSAQRSVSMGPLDLDKVHKIDTGVNSGRLSAQSKQSKRKHKKLPYQEDYFNRGRLDYTVSELSDSELPLGFDAFH